MTTDSNPLGLYIPQQTLEFIDAPYLKPRDAEHWIEELPIAHVGETARLVYKAMAELNRVSMPAQQRFKLLELFRNPFDYVTKALQKHYINQAFPLSTKNQKIAELARELQWEIAIGYKIIIDASLSKRGGRVDNKVLLTSIFRAMSYLGDCQLKSYLIYAPQNEQAWLEIHHLYLFSEHNGFISESVKDPMDDARNGSSISDLYKQIVLLSLANPYRLPQGEISKVADSLKQWSKYSHLHMLDDPSNPIGLFAIDLENNQPPSYYNTSQKPPNTTFVRILDTSELTRILRDQLENGEPLQDITQLKKKIPMKQETLRRLVLAWGAVPKRNFSRKGKKERVKVTLGLNASHYYVQKHYEGFQKKAKLSSEAFPDSQVVFDEKADFLKPKVSPDQQNKQPDIWDMAANPSLYQRVDGAYDFPLFSSTMKKEANALKAPEETYEAFNCLMLNESAGGYCISWDTKTSTKTVVGSLIGVKKEDQEQAEEWHIGVIRWIKTADENSMQIGIELLSPSAQAIATRNVSKKSQISEFTRSLLLPEIRSVEQPQTLLTPSNYSVGDKLELDIHGQGIRVKLTKLLENTSTFSQFQFSIIKTVKKVKPTDKFDRIKNFDSIWSSI